MRIHPKETYAQVIAGAGFPGKKDTVKKILKKHGICNWRARRRPLLTEVNAAKRLAWCLKWRGLTAEEWGLIYWSDKYSVKRGKGKQDEWVFRTANQV
jgi:hypothetical protein